jgi:chromosome partitioning protein
MRVVSFAANKGGVGKTRFAILTANLFAKTGRRVLFLDMDFNNSADHYYLRREEDGALDGRAETRNVAEALRKDTNNLNDYVIETVREGVWIMPSSRYMSDIRAINEHRLRRMIRGLEGRFDFVIIDCKPDYDNITLNAINASDYIITPVLKCLDSVNAAAFYDYKLSTETDKRNNWRIVINGYNKRFEAASGGRQREYIEVFEERFDNITPRSTWFPWCAEMNEIKDRRRLLSGEKAVTDGNGRRSVVNKALYNAVIHLAECFTEGGRIERPEAF